MWAARQRQWGTGFVCSQVRSHSPPAVLHSHLHLSVFVLAKKVDTYLELVNIHDAFSVKLLIVKCANLFNLYSYL